MQSNNPVFSRNEGFNGATSDPSTWSIDLSDSQVTSPGQLDRMTYDNVIEKTALTLGLVILSAAATWIVIGNMSDGLYVDQSTVNKAYAFAMGGAIIGLVLSLVNSFKKVISPALVMAYAVAEGVFVGAFSKVVATWIGSIDIVFQAVMATMIAFGGTLFAYKFFNIQVTDKFRKVVTISVFSFAGVMLVNFVLSITGVLDNGGLRGFNALGLAVSAIAVVLAVFMLIMDFDYVDQGVAAGLPARESWRAAFGLTVTLVWLYIELLRILAILRGDD